MDISTRSGNCIHTNRVTGTLAKQMAGMTSHVSPRSIIKRAAEKAIIMVAMEKQDRLFN
jgi:hypothetical protein